MTRRLVVVGDALLDRDIDGTVDRLSPCAPVPVLAEQSTVDRPGGAGLAAVLAARQGHDVTLVAPIADDAGGARLTELLAGAGVTLCGLRGVGETVEKMRLCTGEQVLLCVDRGSGVRAGDDLPPAAREALAHADAVLVSDYGRGTARLGPLRTVLGAARTPIVWDPHTRGPAPVPGVRLATPNETELSHLCGGSDTGPRLTVAARRAEEVRRRWRAAAVAVTLGNDGALLSHAGPTPLVLSAPARLRGDTNGAGDRFAVSAALAIAGGALVSEAVEVAVRDASSFVASGGVRAAHESPPAPARGAHIGARAAGEVISRVRADGGTVVATGGCFDLLHAGHLATLEAARRLGDCLVVCVNSDASVAALKGPERPLVPASDRGRLLAALACVDAVVVFDEPTPDRVLTWLRPDIWVKGGDYSGGPAGEADLPEADLVRGWGGQAVVVPYVAGRSTTRMIAAARGGHE